MKTYIPTQIKPFILLSVILLISCTSVPVNAPTVIKFPIGFSDRDALKAIKTSLSYRPKHEVPLGVEIADDIITRVFGKDYSITQPRIPQQWFFIRQEANFIYAGYYLNQYYLEVEIQYNKDNATIKIFDSRNLNQTETGIHRKAYTWVDKLEKSIERNAKTIHVDKSQQL